MTEIALREPLEHVAERHRRFATRAMPLFTQPGWGGPCEVNQALFIGWCAMAVSYKPYDCEIWFDLSFWLPKEHLRKTLGSDLYPPSHANIGIGRISALAVRPPLLKLEEAHSWAQNHLEPIFQTAESPWGFRSWIKRLK